MYARGSRWARKEETIKPLSKNFPQWSNYFSLSVFYIERNGGRRFNVVKPNSIRDEKKDPNTAILPLLTWLTVTESANSKTSSAFMVGLCWSAQSSFCVLVSLCSTSFLSQKSPVGLFFFLHKSYQFQNTHGVLQWCLKVVDSVRLFFFSDIYVDSQTSAADGRDTQKLE